MAATLKNHFQMTAVGVALYVPDPPKSEVPMIGTYKVDYSEPTQEAIDAANASCADLFATGEWISVNRKS